VSAESVDKDAIFLFANLLGGGVVYGTWTLAIEFQFYIAFPFIRKIFWRASRAAVALNFSAILFLFLFFRTAFYLKTGNAQEVAYWTMFGRADQFLFGMLAGVLFVNVQGDPPKWLRFVVWPCLVAAALLTAGYYDWFNETGGYYNRGGYPSPSPLWIVMPTIEGILWSSVIALYCLAAAGWSNRLSRAISYLGAISYSMYMIHYLTLPAITAALKSVEPLQLFGGPFANQSVIVVAVYYPVTLLLSTICYETIERPFLAARVAYVDAPSGAERQV
jgi:peptidoglycan/LPS O-acetylase OafA/YrhL